MAQKAVDRVNGIYEQARKDYVNSIADMSSRPPNIPFLYKGGALTQLRILLSDVVPSIQHTAAIALGRMAGQNETIAEEILHNDTVSPLLKGLECKNKIYKRAALYLLRMICRHSVTLAHQLVYMGALSAIILCLEDFDPKVREASCWASEFISRHSPTLAAAVVDAGALPLFVVCLQEPEVGLKNAASAAISSISYHSLDLAQACVDARAIPFLVRCVKNPDIRIKRQFFLALSHIAKHSPELAELVVEAEVIPQALLQTTHLDDLTKKHAAMLIREVVKHSIELVEYVVNCGGIGALVNMIEKTKGATRLPAIMALGFIGAQVYELASVIIREKGLTQLSIVLCEEKEDHILAATAWAIGQIAKHTPEHAKAAALANVFPKLNRWYCCGTCTEDLRQKARQSLKMILQKCTHLPSLESLLYESPPVCILKYVLGQFSKVLPHDPRARKIFVTSGGLRKVQQMVTEPGTPLNDYKTIINLCFPEELINYYSPTYPLSLLKRLEGFEPKIPPEVLLAERISSEECAEGETSYPHYEDESDIMNREMGALITPMDMKLSEFETAGYYLDGEMTPSRDDSNTKKKSSDSIETVNQSIYDKISRACKNDPDSLTEKENKMIQSKSAPAAVTVPLVEIGRRTPASDIPSNK